MASGVVKWFNSSKGYGFICQANNKQEVFAHYSAISMDGYRSLNAGQEVEFDLQDGPKGPHALNIRATEHAQKEMSEV